MNCECVWVFRYCLKEASCLKFYNIEIMQELNLDPTFGCVVPNFYFSPIVLKPFNGKKKSVAFVITVLIVCLSSPCQSLNSTSMMIIIIHRISQNYSNSRFMRISASCCRRDPPASKPTVYMSENLASMTKTARTIGSFAQGYSGLKGLFLPCKLWMEVWKEFVKMSTV